MSHKHSELIHLWADGATIEYRSMYNGNWYVAKQPNWDVDVEYRLKEDEDDEEI